MWNSIRHGHQKFVTGRSWDSSQISLPSRGRRFPTNHIGRKKPPFDNFEIREPYFENFCDISEKTTIKSNGVMVAPFELLTTIIPVISEKEKEKEKER